MSENKVPSLLLTLRSKIIIVSNNFHATHPLSNYQQNDDDAAENHSNIIQLCPIASDNGDEHQSLVINRSQAFPTWYDNGGKHVLGR